MKRTGSASLAGIFPVKRQSSSSCSLKKADGHHSRDARGYGLAAAGRSASGRLGRGNSSREMSLDDLLGEQPSSQPEVTSPPPKMLAPPPRHPPIQFTLASPQATTPVVPDASLFSSPFAAWKGRAFDAEPDNSTGRPSGSCRALLSEQLCQLATPTAGAHAATVGASDFLAGIGGRASRGTGLASAAPPASEPENDENDESLGYLVSPPPVGRRSKPTALLTPEKEGQLGSASMQPMPSLSSWMVSAAKPPPPLRQGGGGSALPSNALDDVLACRSFNPAQPRALEEPPSPLDRLLADMGDSDFAASVGLWDEQLSVADVASMLA